jgi:hypothetical protein
VLFDVHVPKLGELLEVVVYLFIMKSCYLRSHVMIRSFISIILVLLMIVVHIQVLGMRLSKSIGLRTMCCSVLMLLLRTS